MISSTQCTLLNNDCVNCITKKKILAAANGTPHTPSITSLSGFRIYKILRGLTLTLWLISLRFAPNF